MLGRLTLADGTPLDNRPGVSYILRHGIKIPDIAWGETVPAGTYTIGGDKEGYGFHKKKVRIERPYQLGCYPVTYAQFRCFATAADFADAHWWAGMPEEEEAYGTVYQLREVSEQAFPFWNHPRESVSWYQAIAFCRWLSDKLGFEVDLPHEYEWEVAARYPDGRFYPWGYDFVYYKANTSDGEPIARTSTVGIYPQGANEALRLYELIGNVWEWCRNKFENPEDVAADDSLALRVLRGASWGSHLPYTRTVFRRVRHPASLDTSSGFRVVCRRRHPSQ
jgi:formylglycine-generating enzyme required for sulfatase activity